MKNRKISVFISYNSEDDKTWRDWTAHLGALLQNRGFEVFIDKDLRGGDSLNAFMAHIASVDYVIVICSDGYVDKATVSGTGVWNETKEIETRRNLSPNSRFVVPVVIKPFNKKEKMPAYLPKDTLYTVVHDPFECNNEINRILDSLHPPTEDTTEPPEKQQPISLAYAMTFKCLCECPICHSAKKTFPEQVGGNPEQWVAKVQKLIDYRGSVRLTLTGGDPMIFWNKKEQGLLEFIKILHEKEVHVCLNTTGINLDIEKLLVLDNYLDTILLSVRGLTVTDIAEEFGLDIQKARQLLDCQISVLEGIKKTNIKLEVSTVVTKKNYRKMRDLGDKLFSYNSNIIWRVEEYYRNGTQVDKPQNLFDLSSSEYGLLVDDLLARFSGKIKATHHVTKESREKAPDVMLFPDGMLHTSSNNKYVEVRHIDDFNFMHSAMRREWYSYLKSLRAWGWERDKGYDEKNSVDDYFYAIPD
jgi:MoaA/NifB/PqqE/SkfB family radical SAM enzyme